MSIGCIRTIDPPRRRSRVLRGIAGAAVLSMCAAVSAAAADTVASPSKQAFDAPPMSVLDGKKFAGRIGPIGEAATTEDLLIFRDGMFVSKECSRRCAYEPGRYWVRQAKNGVQFKANMRCSESDATIAWRGTVKGDGLEGTLTWSSHRWYWTIEKQFWFKGTLVESESRMTE